MTLDALLRIVGTLTYTINWQYFFDIILEFCHGWNLVFSITVVGPEIKINQEPNLEQLVFMIASKNLVIFLCLFCVFDVRLCLDMCVWLFGLLQQQCGIPGLLCWCDLAQMIHLTHRAFVIFQALTNLSHCCQAIMSWHWWFWHTPAICSNTKFFCTKWCVKNWWDCQVDCVVHQIYYLRCHCCWFLNVSFTGLLFPR